MAIREATPGAPVPIAWVSMVGDKGGAEALMLECIRALDRKRFTPHVLQLRPGPLQQLLEEAGAVVYVREPHRMRQVLRVAGGIADLSRLVRRHGIRLLHSNGFRAHVYSGMAARLTGIPEVWTTHQPEPPGLWTRAILAIPTAHVLANCRRTADYYVAQGLKVSTVFPGVTIDRLARGTPRDVLAERFSLPAGRRWLSVSARLQRFKGQDHFLRALARQPEALGVHGIVIGGSLFGQEPGWAGELKVLAQQLGIERRVTFTGFVSDEDLAGLIAASELLVHPALDEDFGISIAEAQALGRAVVAYAAVGPREIVCHGETGWLVQVGDEQALTEAITMAMSNDALRAASGAAGSVRVRARYSSEAHARQTEAIYESALRA